jgi:hypothetical protein
VCGHDYLWLADGIETLDDILQDSTYRSDRPHQAQDDWRSPFIGKSKQELGVFVMSVPKPPKALNKVHFAILEREQYKSKRWITVCKIVDGEVQSVPCGAEMISVFFTGYDRHTWAETLRLWQTYGVATME